MNTPFIRFVSPIAFGLCALAFILTGCTRQERADATAKTKDVVNDAKVAVTNTWNDMKAYTFDKRNDFTSSAKAMSSKLESEISQLRADYSEAKASASRKAAMEELKNAEADYKQKLSALGGATADTWESAKQNVIAAWDRLQAAYHKARAN